jgi:hypothetical protein
MNEQELTARKYTVSMPDTCDGEEKVDRVRHPFAEADAADLGSPNKSSAPPPHPLRNANTNAAKIITIFISIPTYISVDV